MARNAGKLCPGISGKVCVGTVVNYSAEYALTKNSTIETLVLTSRTKIVGALGLFETYLYQRDLFPPKFWENADKIIEGNLVLGNREIEILIPYSTSRTVIEKKRATVPQLAEMYRLCLT